MDEQEDRLNLLRGLRDFLLRAECSHTEQLDPSMERERRGGSRMQTLAGTLCTLTLGSGLCASCSVWQREPRGGPHETKLPGRRHVAVLTGEHRLGAPQSL